ncbi:MAG: glycosyltransferase family 4 protein [Candidatus Diapherotrites archaeon]|nr:glycosyltransferase family 4 protein [Candidatus Diapherotrites archaeon]
MRILYITHTYSLNVWDQGGGEVYCSNLLKELSRRGHEILVFTPACKRWPKEEKEFNIRVHMVPTFGHHALHKYEYVFTANEAVRLAKEFNAKLVHAQNDIFPALVGAKVKKALNIPLVVGVEYISEKNASLNTKLIYWLNRTLLPRIPADHFISMSRHAVDHYLVPWGIEKNKIMVLPVSVDLELFKPGPGKKELVENYGPNLLVSLKPMHATNAQALELVLRAFKKVLGKHADYHYLLYGGGAKLEYLKALAHELGLEKSVHFMGLVNYSDTPSIYNASQFLVHAFTYEATTSSSLIDSLAAGKAVIATRIGEIPNIVEDAAVLVPPNNVNALAEAMLDLMEHPKKRFELEKKARAIAEKRHSLNALGEGIEKVYERALTSFRTQTKK